MQRHQKGILAALPKAAQFLTFTLKSGARPRRALAELVARADGDQCVLGVGVPLVHALGAEIPGLRSFPSGFGTGLALPSTQAALWCWLRGTDRGTLLHQGRHLREALAGAFEIDSVVDGFQHDGGRDLSGYVDGTENPKGAKAAAAAIARDAGTGLDGSSYVAVQLWVHDFARLEAMSPKAQDNAIGRRKVDDVELEKAPRSAHVKRTAQESFDPEAFVLRRSMPWSDGNRAGLNFIAFGRTLDAYEALLRRMVGAEDGITDALFKFTRPISGSYFWCPPMRGTKLDLRAIGL
ncbi:MAG: Dyp-type peroxidase [Gammaproteobacteria bacterium]